MSSRPDVLFVDDEALIRLFTLDALDDAGIRVIAAANADEALKRLEENPCISVLFTDINMPGKLDGLQLARAARKSRPDMQVIVTSGRGLPSAGDMPPGSLFLAKPYSGDSIVKLINAAVAAKN